MTPPHAYLVGGGIASLAAAAYLIRDGRVPGENIHLLSEAPVGGSMDAGGSAAQGYSMHGTRMFGAAYVLTYDLFASIPSLEDPDKSVTDVNFEFWQSAPWFDRARLVHSGELVDLSSWGFSNKDRVDLIGLMMRGEEALGAKPIDEYFDPPFFETNFWLMWSTMFGFETWHSAAELRRYLLRFLRLFPDLETMAIIQVTRYNSYDSLIRPLVRWLEERGVSIETDVQVTDLIFAPSKGGKAVRRIAGIRAGKLVDVDLGEGDLAIVTLGSMTADSSVGSMTTAPVLRTEKSGSAWTLWERLAEKDGVFGRPSRFCDHIDQTKWVTFTVTDSDDTFVRLMQRLSSSPPGRGGLVTLTSSSWRLTLHLFHPPAYPDQPDGVFVWWGYGLFPDNVGDYVEKPMALCTGREILIETFSHLGFQADMAVLLSTSSCIPCMLPYTTSQFMPRARGDRPDVIPTGTDNLAFVGQYCEIPDDVVYTFEYSIHSARLAVTSLLGLEGEIPPTYRGLEHPYALTTALRRILEPDGT